MRTNDSGPDLLFTRGQHTYIYILRGSKTGKVSVVKEGSEVIYTTRKQANLRETGIYRTGGGGKKGLLRTNTTRPSRCDCAANTIGEGREQSTGGGGWWSRGKREFVARNRKVAKLGVGNKRWDQLNHESFNRRTKQKPSAREHNKKVREVKMTLSKTLCVQGTKKGTSGEKNEPNAGKQR